MQVGAGVDNDKLISTQVIVAQTFIEKAHINSKQFVEMDKKFGLLEYLKDHWFYIEDLSTSEILDILNNHIAGNSMDTDQCGKRSAQRLLTKWLINDVSARYNMSTIESIRSVLKSKTYELLISSEQLWKMGMKNLVELYEAEIYNGTDRFNQLAFRLNS